MKKLTGVFIPPMMTAPMIVTIPNDLAAFQTAVGGYIETVDPAVMNDHNVVMLVNEQGRLIGLDINRIATYCFSGIKNRFLSKYDPRVIVGDALIVGVDGEEFTDLTDYQVHWIQVMGHPFVEWEDE